MVKETKKMYLFDEKIQLKQAVKNIGNINAISRILINWKTGRTIWEVE